MQLTASSRRTQSLEHGRFDKVVNRVDNADVNSR